MKKIISIIYIAIIGFCVTSCENDIDNYTSPNGGIKGTIYDAKTNEAIPLPVEGGNGVIVNLHEIGTNATKSIDFRAKQDGTYENSKVFNCEYRVVVNGPFVDACEGIVTVKGQTQFDLTATPYSRVSISASADASNKVTINYAAVASNASDKVESVSIIWNFAPGVDVNSSNYATLVNSNDAEGIYTFDLPNDARYKDNHYKIVANGNKVYVRVAAKVNGKVNYSKTMEVVLK